MGFSYRDALVDGLLLGFFGIYYGDFFVCVLCRFGSFLLYFNGALICRLAPTIGFNLCACDRYVFCRFPVLVYG